MRRLAARVWRIVLGLPLAVVAPVMLGVAAAGLAVADLVGWVRTRITPAGLEACATSSQAEACATVVIPNWNGRELLEKYLPSVVAAGADEIIVVDNASEDGSAEFLREHFPQVRVIALDRNLGFGAGSNAGFQAARNDVVVLLNNDMRVEPGFLQPLLEGFMDKAVFAVACQIFFSDPAKAREETGLTEGW